MTTFSLFSIPRINYSAIVYVESESRIIYVWDKNCFISRWHLPLDSKNEFVYLDAYKFNEKLSDFEQAQKCAIHLHNVKNKEIVPDKILIIN